MAQRPEIIIGLGNPGKKYENTYHNAGFLFLEHLRSQVATAPPWIHGGKLYDFSSVNDVKLIRPLTFMNRSGDAALAVLQIFHTHPQCMLVVHDDHDLPLGSYKFAEPGTGSAGHYGIQSIIESIGNTFPRLRIGIQVTSHMPSADGETLRQKADMVVLKPIRTDDLAILKSIFTTIAYDLSIVQPSAESEN